jgi:uncharacterized protein YndB with AHSA1/START domain
MAEVSRSITLNAPLEEVWSLIGNFQGLADWHPAAASVTKEEVEGAEHRRIAIKGGGEIFEKLLDHGGGTYSYTIIESPLPVKDYVSMLSAAELGGQTVVTWGATFDPTGDGAEEAVGGIYDAGFGALAKRFGG